VPRSSLTDDEDAGGGTSRKISAHLPIAYPIEMVPEITGIPRTKIFEAVRAKSLTARKVGRSTIIERTELERFIKTLPIKGRIPDAAAARAGGG
jgi:excisionase family DNA binding protein